MGNCFCETEDHSSKRRSHAPSRDTELIVKIEGFRKVEEVVTTKNSQPHPSIHLFRKIYLEQQKQHAPTPFESNESTGTTSLCYRIDRRFEYQAPLPCRNFVSVSILSSQLIRTFIYRQSNIMNELQAFRTATNYVFIGCLLACPSGRMICQRARRRMVTGGQRQPNQSIREQAAG